MISYFAQMSGLLLLLTGTPAAVLSEQTQQNPTIASSPQSKPIGGVQLDVEPRRAQVFVDGTYAGVVDDFRGYYRHLALPAGPHRIDVMTAGYLPLNLDVMVVPDRTIVYRWSLQDAPRGW